MGEIFNQIGIYGVPVHKENAILTGLFNGDPVLLIGKQGCAKTALVEGLGSALREYSKQLYPDNSARWFNFHSYDSSKINFEDLIGIPNPAKMLEGKTEYMRSPTTVWDKDLISFDEFNRQEPSRQNNIFEIIRSRRIMGMETEVSFIMNCMNPFDMAGTEVLDEALVDRHQFFIMCDDFYSLSDENKEKVVGHIGASDSPGLRYWGKFKGDFDVSEDEGFVINQNLADTGKLINDLMLKAHEHFTELMREKGKDYRKFVAKFLTTFKSQLDNKKDLQTELSGRRGGMIWRALIAYRAIELAKCDILPRSSMATLKDTFRNVLHMTLPIGISEIKGSGRHPEIFKLIDIEIETYNEFFVDGGLASAMDTIYDLFNTTSIARKISIITEEIKDEQTKNFAWNNILTVKTEDDKHKKILSSVLVNLVAHLMTINRNLVPDNFQKLVTTQANELYNEKELFKELKLQGLLATKAKDIEAHVKEWEDPFLKLQAKVLWEQQSYMNRKGNRISERDFLSMKRDVQRECEELEDMIKICKNKTTTEKQPAEIF
jgi:hypothetical protein